jgi:hypothetical protein
MQFITILKKALFYLRTKAIVKIATLLEVSFSITVYFKE